MPLDSSDKEKDTIKSEIRVSLKNFESYRNNSDNEGGNENSIFEPSTYGAESYYPNWMRGEDEGYLFLVALIGSDPGFETSNWISFFHGVRPQDRDKILRRLATISRVEYSNICNRYGVAPFIGYEEFRSKIVNFPKMPASFR